MLGYADDHVVYNSFLPANEVSAFEELTELTTRIRDWMKSSFLKMNDSKTELVIFGTQKSTKQNYNNIYAGWGNICKISHLI